MLIKGPTLLGPLKSLLAGPASERKRWSPARFLLLAVFVLAMVLLQAAGLHAVTRWTRAGRARDALTGVRNWMAARTARPAVLDIHIAFTDRQKLAFLREEALKAGVIDTSDDSWVPADILIDARQIPVKMRLKGDVTDHLEGDKWSFRIRVKGDDAVFGMKHFSIQDPRRSAFVHEWIMHRILERAGLIALRYDFVDVRINGEPMGIHALEESFGVELLEANRRREAPIIKFDETWLWDPRAWAYGSVPGQADVYYAAPIDAFESTQVEADPALAAQFERARGLLERFRAGEASVSQVFDVGRTATLFAHLDLATAWHAARWKNMRFYSNPFTGKLEPIAYNAYDALPQAQGMVAGAGPTAWDMYEVPQWMEAFFKDPEFYALYVQALERVASEGYLEGLFEGIAPELDQKIRIIHRDDPSFEFSSLSYFANRDLIQRVLDPRIPILARHRRGEPVLHAANTGHLAIGLLRIVDLATGKAYPLPGEARLAAKQFPRPVFANVGIGPEAAEALRNAGKGGRFGIVWRILGTDRERTDDLVVVDAPPRTSVAGGPSGVDALAAHPAFRVDRLSREVHIRPGRWQLDRTVAIPADYRLSAGPDTRVVLKDGASIISYGPIQIIGAAARPVVIEREGAAPGGIAVLGAGSTSRLEHAVLRRMALPQELQGGLTGGVTFYESPVEIRNVAFEGSEVEDALNIVRSSLTIEGASFGSARGDCLDIDFGDGLVADSRFDGCGNNAVDVSGSAVKLRGIRVEKAGDKGLSVSEGSTVAVEGMRVASCSLGLVSRDLSTVTGRDITIEGCQFGIGAYQKKTEFGPATVALSEVAIRSVGTDLRVEKGSWVRLDGRMNQGHELGLARELYDR